MIKFFVEIKKEVDKYDLELKQNDLTNVFIEDE